MEPLTETEVNQQLLGCTVQKAKMYTYTDLLGFRQLSHSKSRSGPQVYKGVVGAFYKATSTLVRELSEEYRSLEQLHNAINAQPYFTHERIEDCLTKYGPKIWGDGLETPFVTRTDAEEEENKTSYSCRLIYKNKADFTR